MKTTIMTEFSYPGQPNTKIVMETDGVVLEDLLQSFEDHLRGCGFLVDGHLELVEDEEIEN